MMKTFSLSVAVVIMLAFLFIQEGCAFPSDDRDPVQHMMEARDDAAADIPADQWTEQDALGARHDQVLKTCEIQSEPPKMDSDARRTPVSNEKRCRLCCGCCRKPPTWRNPIVLPKNILRQSEMKTFSVVIAVTIMMAFICLQENSASSVSGTQELDDVLDEDSPVPALEETSEESWKLCELTWRDMPYSNRHKRAFKCRFCCGCCKPGICGVCCRF
ncbi:uncharacterized protein LOC144022399 [Festucalex cinctus]